ncbi:mannose-1-phosphate guanylyltransferase/mannose-6-phosphate isomerase [Pseudothauera rhizosphaerae]|uniref:mannose-1-phosphate guanylyltransferase n=1 Tax=Pseudothauera rhizosphaerae TaxID=2565932 RepID=A0A4S4ARP6_9RHOO|nr:mannose-1-phosphate guanylyltransferase/mannose-6-phosphate isomerase [Pseudothauera rhizosphaerae]THF62452.1 mannose-1-phosphate guanylyltransferase/mannose-6-phosphate isomerase [Pseudothauera rhizosphaerae]
MKVQPVILCGGSGTRLWPLSREQYPKQLLQLAGERSMLQETVLRIADLARLLPVSPTPIVVCNEEYRFITAEQLRECGYPCGDILLEPFGRNTAPALTLAALAALAYEDDALLLVMPADHLIRDGAAFARAVAAGAPAAEVGDVVTFGIQPTRVETGYGYLRIGAVDASGTFPVEAFVEKPDQQTAARYVADGNHLWNSGIFLLRASVWLHAIERFAPSILLACKDAFAAAVRDADFVRVERTSFEGCPADSVDYAVMEHLPGAANPGVGIRAVPMAAGWSDVGAWDALWDVSDKDGQDNVVRGDVLTEGVRSSMVVATDRLVACVGVSDLVVVETADAVLVAGKDATQGIKDVVARLKREGRVQADAHRKIHRPWGYYDAIDAGERFQVKRIVVKPGGTLSLQMHHHRAEHWVVVRGTARVTRGEECFLLGENESTYIPLGVTHRLENPGKLPLEIIEVQSGSYLGEDDIVRLEDYYGRG